MRSLQGRSSLVTLRPMKHECHESQQKLFHPLYLASRDEDESAGEQGRQRGFRRDEGSGRSSP